MNRDVGIEAVPMTSSQSRQSLQPVQECIADGGFWHSTTQYDMAVLVASRAKSVTKTLGFRIQRMQVMGRLV
jgi:hypothetical protein